jgi:CRP-like cAMP-binding protein
LPAENRLIELLPTRERARFVSACEPVKLVLSDTIFEAGSPTKHVYFPLTGFISLVAVVDDHSALEVGMVGREGMLGVHLALGVDVSPLRSIVQGSGEAWRLTAGQFRAELSRSIALRTGIDRYIAVLMSQMASSAACARYHVIEPRLARWLLMTRDRAGSDHFHVTQEFLSYMLGVRRVGVTTAAGKLQCEGLIEYHRGDVTIVDRRRLESRACRCYASDRAAYASLARPGTRDIRHRAGESSTTDRPRP